ncbi:MAG: imidazolonepropionase [Gammaproteobacteria bacterium]|nr:imidazolonepropionase [Gammaproteobacteria bacterium]MDH3856454.1 imidazolonepropionase [Gammaproteobacteria bacterium]
MSQTLFTNATLACVDDESGYGLRDDAALLVADDQIAWLGPMTACPETSDCEIIDCENRLLTPGLVDCHTHVVYGGDRADEFEQRLEGASYADIAAAGGGIASTVKATRAASADELFEQALPRVRQLMDEGMTTLEIKSGYGLDGDTEIKMLRVASQLEAELGLRIRKTFLGAHSLPTEFKGRSDDYIALVCDEMLPRAHAEGLVDAVDVFIESVAFSVAQGERVLVRAQELGLPVKAHVEQLSAQGGAAMAAGLGALSVDHLEYLNSDDVASLVQAGTVAVLLPGAFYFLREQQLPPIAALREQRVPIALASDANPGSSPVHSLLLIMNMACTLFRLTPAEALRGVTLNAARALGMAGEIGSLEIGKQADIVIWDVDRPALLSYRVGMNPCRAVMQAGQWRERNRLVTA